MHTTKTLSLCMLLVLLFNVVVAGNEDNSGESGNPFTPKGYLIRYWKKQVSNDLPKPWFLLNKASPLNAAQYATYTKLVADQNALSTQLHSFCSSANLLCAPDLSPSLEKHSQDVNFASYNDKNFTNYGTTRAGGFDGFKNYSDGENIPVDSFRRYSRDSGGHDDRFSNYAPDGNVIDQSFNTYGTNAAGGTGKFTNYGPNVNVPNIKFTSYSDAATGRNQDFTAYSQNANAGDQSFSNYGKNGNGADSKFTSYGTDTNVIGSTFTNYGQTANGGNQNFTSYGTNGNVPENNFKNYGAGGNGPTETFTNYRDQANVGDDNFQNYIKDTNAGEANFVNYGQSFNEGTDKFTGYGKGANDPKVNFKTYGVNNTFKDYVKDSATFSNYHNKSSQVLASLTEVNGGKMVNNRWVEPGKFFREKMLKSGTIMPMPDIKDKMPKRSFLPRVIAAKLPFSTSKIGEMKKIFHAGDDSPVAKMIGDALTECERAPSAGETKRCINSAEDMIDFATSVLGRNVVVRTTENTKGSKENIIIGSVKGINGGKVTKSVSCHQSLFPYLLYYCHSVPKVRVYEADILDPNSKAKINHGVAICHVDTSSWGPSHGAFVALGSGPGKIEVCHWIFENDMTWAIAD
ncbi:polygalacturonase non-catalytic subunit AroGP3-like [Nicotiana tabacum]|uniref:Polygalacturonase non-catalytic subunit AroGP3-like n=1 Tax=Nicotiana tabacum TaxID=4097 RepID=A0A1S4CKW7_TOBAC|nr:polygalacturonase-1 non-catalytic subunit beta-like [Nicotiana tomentosiformis]XP_016501887.1 PREDICTED: polygalacturonase-1 non-catalytic subunit beta-like [Nicotiana tabacum]